MAGGIDWFRWHHGSVTDQKFPLIARKAGASVAEVIAVWACLLEAASMNAELRGHLGGEPDFEAIDCALGIEEGRSVAIYAAMVSRGLVDGCGHISAWPKRQPKREREDDKSTARVQAFRERQRHETPGNASESAETPRGEESREEQYLSKPTASHPLKRGMTPSVPCPVGQIVELYHSALPDLPTAKLMPPAREKAIRKVWAWVLSSKKSDGQPRATNADEALAWLASYFGRAGQNDFLMGRTPRMPGHENWRCDLDFLLTDKGMKQVIEKTTDRDAA